ncbi:MAG: hypothetical protein ACJ76Y_18415 [Thermoanaerobaculia bacterium]
MKASEALFAARSLEVEPHSPEEMELEEEGMPHSLRFERRSPEGTSRETGCTSCEEELARHSPLFGRRQLRGMPRREVFAELEAGGTRLEKPFAPLDPGGTRREEPFAPLKLAGTGREGRSGRHEVGGTRLEMQGTALEDAVGFFEN